ncbi:unnamed protein product, partial [Closterium sp. NIES-53]
VSLSSLNRHAVATRADVGISKAQCMREHFLRILPEALVEGMTAMYTEENEAKVLSGQPGQPPFFPHSVSPPPLRGSK